MGLSDDFKMKAYYTAMIHAGLKQVGVAKRKWLKEFGKDSESQVDLVIEEATETAEKVVTMDDNEFEDFLEQESKRIMREIMSRADAICVEEDDEEEFENERRENGDIKGRIS